jgi:hypothetical protein
MTYSVNNPVAVWSALLWLGFVCAISFMETWLKFTAPGITLALGLGIGRIVFHALNFVEWIFALSILGSFLYQFSIWVNTKPHKMHSFFALALSILLFQGLWLLPVLDERAEHIIHGDAVPLANFHMLYVALEVLKVFALIVFISMNFRKTQNQNI